MSVESPGAEYEFVYAGPSGFVKDTAGHVKPLPRWKFMHNHTYTVPWWMPEYLNSLMVPADRVVQVHLAGHTNHGTHILDTHSGPAIDAVWDLYARLCARTGPVSTLFEWDAEIPPLAVVREEAEKARPLRTAAVATGTDGA